MFSVDCDLSEEDFLEAALHIETILTHSQDAVNSKHVANSDGRLSSGNMVNDKQLYGNTVVSKQCDVPHGETKPVDVASVFSLSQDEFIVDEFDVMCGPSNVRNNASTVTNAQSSASTNNSPQSTLSTTRNARSTAQSTATNVRSTMSTAQSTATNARSTTSTATNARSTTTKSRSTTSTVTNARSTTSTASSTATDARSNTLSSLSIMSSICSVSDALSAEAHMTYRTLADNISTSLQLPVCTDVMTVLTCHLASPSTTCTSPLRRKRKFPGPAGILPKLKSVSDLNKVELLTKSSTVANKTSDNVVNIVDITLSQSTDDHFHCCVWQTALGDLQPLTDNILSHFSIKEIIRLANNHQLQHSKVAVICAVIDSVNSRGVDASLTLRDPTGCISGTVHRDVIKDYATYIHAGTVLVLRQVSVLSPLGRNYYVNITPNNIVNIYSAVDSSLSGSVTTVRVRHLGNIDFSAVAQTSQNCLVFNSRPTVNSLRPMVNTPTTCLRPTVNSLRPMVNTPTTCLRPTVNSLRPMVNSPTVHSLSPCLLQPVVNNLSPCLPGSATCSEHKSSIVSLHCQVSPLVPSCSLSTSDKFSFRRPSNLSSLKPVDVDVKPLLLSQVAPMHTISAAVLQWPVKATSHNTVLSSGSDVTTTNCLSTDLWQIDAVDDEMLFNITEDC